MFTKSTRFFSSHQFNLMQLTQRYQQQLTHSKLTQWLSKTELNNTNPNSTKLYYNDHYFQKNNGFLVRAIEKTAGISVAGDRDGFWQDGHPFPQDTDFFAKLKAGDPRGLSSNERMIASKKIICSNSYAFAYGGYPLSSPKVSYLNPLPVSIFSQAGAQFEMPYLHYSLFALDSKNLTIKDSEFSHLYEGLPASFDDAKKELCNYDLNRDFGRLRVGFPFLCRRENGSFYSSLFRQNAIIFLNRAYATYVYEDVALLLASVNDAAKKAGKLAYLKATAVGMGFFAQVDCRYDIKHHLYPYYLRAYRDLLATGDYLHIAVVEFPTFTPIFEEIYDNNMTNPSYGNVKVYQSGRDVLQFTQVQAEQYFLCVINPSDTNALPGNEWGYGSVESSIGNNSTLRLDQVYLINPTMLNSENHIAVTINVKNFKTEVTPTAEKTSMSSRSKFYNTSMSKIDSQYDRDALSISEHPAFCQESSSPRNE